MNVGDIVYYYAIKIDFAKHKVDKSQNQSTILGINDNYIILDDLNFTKLERKKERSNSYSVINHAITSKWKFGSYDEVRVYIYTDSSDEKKIYKLLKKKLETYLYEQYGRYCEGIDLMKGLDI